jgi:hypothetical protein
MPKRRNHRQRLRTAFRQPVGCPRAWIRNLLSLHRQSHAVTAGAILTPPDRSWTSRARLPPETPILPKTRRIFLLPGSTSSFNAAASDASPIAINTAPGALSTTTANCPRSFMLSQRYDVRANCQHRFKGGIQRLETSQRFVMALAQAKAILHTCNRSFPNQ